MSILFERWSALISVEEPTYHERVIARVIDNLAIRDDGAPVSATFQRLLPVESHPLEHLSSKIAENCLS